MSKKKRILDLKPTQFAIGMLEVDEKIRELQAMKKKDFKKYFDETEVPVVRAPNGQLYIVDKHHYLAVCYHLDIEKVRVTIVKDFKDQVISYRHFWKWMGRSRNAYLFSQFGEGPHQEYYLPKDIRGLADDPYRSLAWFVRKAGGFENSEKNFAEFRWANFFREKRLLDKDGMLGFEAALVKAVRLSQSPSARHLPGFSVLNPTKHFEAEKKALKKIRKYKKRFKERAVVAE